MLVIGNSHAGALKDAWSAGNTGDPDIKIDFFAAPTHIFGQMKLSRDLKFYLPADHPKHDEFTNVLNRINNRPSADLTRVDRVLRVGSACAFQAIEALLSRFSIDGYAAPDLSARMSQAAYDAVSRDIATSALPDAQWCDGLQGKLVVMPRPVASERSTENTSQARFRVWTRATRVQHRMKTLLIRYFDRVAETLDEHGVALLRQPSDTLSETGHTEARYATGSISMPDSNGPLSDYTHMNADYGRHCLESLFALIRNTSDVRADARMPTYTNATT